MAIENLTGFSEAIIKAFEASLEADKIQFEKLAELTEKLNACQCGESPLAIMALVISLIAIALIVFVILRRHR